MFGDIQEARKLFEHCASLYGALAIFIINYFESFGAPCPGQTAMVTAGALAALVLGLLVASAKSSYDAQKDGLDQISARILSLDATLAEYGPETKDARDLLRRTVAPMSVASKAMADRITALRPVAWCFMGSSCTFESRRILRTSFSVVRPAASW
ncbi:MAG: hypothetical protein ACREEE_01575 [Dongiaceae bacterium]